MRNLVARVARATIATSRPKRSEIVADINRTILSTLHDARFPRVEEHSALQEHKKAPGHADQASRRSIHSSRMRSMASIVTHLFLAQQGRVLYYSLFDTTRVRSRPRSITRMA